jgi:predicted phage terminase large subunit-like protein
LTTDKKEVLYGGAAGGGKSDALLMAALQYVEVPGYRAIIFRRTYPQLSQPDGLIPRAEEWLSKTDATGTKYLDGMPTKWKFPSGAELHFGHMQYEKDRLNYQGGAYHFTAFDELTHFTAKQYRYLFSRRRKLKEDIKVPLRTFSASNPGGDGHEWVKQRFIVEGKLKGREYISAKLKDNPSLDSETYIESLMELDPTTRAQLLNGDWSAREPGNLFQRQWFPIVAEGPGVLKLVRYWDMAATEAKLGKDPDWTVGVLMGFHRGVFYIEDIKRTRSTPQNVEALIKQTAVMDGREVRIYMEQEPGSAGVTVIDHYRRNVLRGFAFWGHKTTGAKATRAAPVSSQAEAGNVKLVQGPWIGDFLDEVEVFPLGTHDDQVDAMSGAFEMLNKGTGSSPMPRVRRYRI